jgi:hypothetical protein
MNNEELAQLIREVKKEVKTETSEIGKKVDKLYNKMFVGNGQLSFDRRLTLIEETQNKCPAVAALTNDSKRLRVNYVTMWIAVIALLLSLLR